LKKQSNGNDSYTPSFQHQPQQQARSAQAERTSSIISPKNVPQTGDGGNDNENDNDDGVGFDSTFNTSSTTATKTKEKDNVNPKAAGCGEMKSTFYGTRCRSTCNIIVSAVADFLPAEAILSKQEIDDDNSMITQQTLTTTSSYPQNEPDPFIFNTTASYTVLPEKVRITHFSSFSKSFF